MAKRFKIGNEKEDKNSRVLLDYKNESIRDEIKDIIKQGKTENVKQEKKLIQKKENQEKELEQKKDLKKQRKLEQKKERQKRREKQRQEQRQEQKNKEEKKQRKKQRQKQEQKRKKRELEQIEEQELKLDKEKQKPIKNQKRIFFNHKTHKKAIVKERIIQQNGIENVKRNERPKKINKIHHEKINKISKEKGIKLHKNIEKIKNIKLKQISFKSKRINKKEIRAFSEKAKRIKQEIAKVIVGQEKVVDGLIRALICNGHVILEGVPGIAKTLLIKALGKTSGCDVKRIQFTVDLLPTDIIGLTIYREKLGFEVIKGPVFTNFIIADEINRAPPKTQSALLEAMQEKQVTIGRKTFLLPRPFFVMATKNPIEAAGVYALPEAQVDRFLFKLLITYPPIENEKLIMKKNIEFYDFEDFNLQQIISPKEIMNMQSLLKEVYLSPNLENYIVNIVDYTRNKKNKHAKYIEWGASPRASIAFFMASKAQALMKGRSFVVPEDIKSVALDILRHRLILSYEAEANNLTPDNLITNILKDVEI